VRAVDSEPAAIAPAAIAVDRVTLSFDGRVVQHDVSFVVRRGEIFVIMGGSGCGKSTVLRSMVGLLRPASGDVLYKGQALWAADESQRARMQRRFGILFQSGALWSSLTLAENVGLPLSQYTTMKPADIDDVVSLKLGLVGLRGFERYYPSEISGGMKKRAGLARAMALDPEILFLDEPSAGLDPLSSKHLDDLILELRATLGATIVLVSHELSSIFSVADNSVFLDADSHTVTARGDPRLLRQGSGGAKVQEFLNRGTALTGAAT
jgi:phospholipid/cholesterol/gamma-HCH transport system ATP-binding protein